MLTLAPFLTVATLVLWAPDHFGGSVDLLSIIVLTFFGLITVPLWATFIPALFLTPLLMDGVSRCDWFRRLPLSAALGLSIPAGMLAGMAVMGIILPWGEDAGGAYVILAWLIASAVSGGATLPVIAAIYRYGTDRAVAGTPPGPPSRDRCQETVQSVPRPHPSRQEEPIPLPCRTTCTFSD
jgi:hypothetical protein